MRSTDHVVLEAAGNTAAIVNVLRPNVARVAIADPLLGRLIAKARVKTDKIDATVLAQRYAGHFLPEVWMPDQNTLTLRRQLNPVMSPYGDTARVGMHSTRTGSGRISQAS
ncbi:hypothetical protein [Burkholderia gladioli]|uniref:hypothetical protein n=2 Tax=Burkholderia gladioli TaxID=28095 RepID=UPI00264D69E2|nr:hypothetical protein [Burkholderia gladioli]MDN7802080.1 hypothetical protein [Burkholderia gladioli]